MCDICNDWKSGKIDSKQAFEKIKDALQNADKKRVGHLMSLSDTILDKDVPLEERDESADQQWGEEYEDGDY